MQFVDDNVLAGKPEREPLIVWPLTDLRYSELLQDIQIIGAFPHGVSYWTRTAEIETQRADGSELSFFIKVYYISSHCHWKFKLINSLGPVQVAQGDLGKSMVSGEFVSMTALHETIPDSTPAPIAWVPTLPIPISTSSSPTLSK